MMTTPKNHQPYQIVSFAKRNTQRQFLLTNAKCGSSKNAAGYICFHYAKQYHIQLHAMMFMSNHYHCILTDRAAMRSEFMRESHNMLTRDVNKRLNRRESIWSSDQNKDQHLLDEMTVEQFLLYTFLNPVRAGLVDRVDDWDHFVILPKHWGKTMTFRRPSFFSSDRFPETIQYTPMPPKCVFRKNESLSQLIHRFEQMITSKEDEYRQNRLLESKSVLGMDACYETNPFDAPKSEEPKRARFERFCAATVDAKKHAKQSYQLFCARYRQCFDDFKKGISVLFPAGTIKMTRVFGVACEGLKEDDPLRPNLGHPPFASG